MPTRQENVELVIQRHFIGKNQPDQVAQADDLANDESTFDLQGLDPVTKGPALGAPSTNVEAQFRAYAQTDLGAKTIEQILANDQIAISKGWQRSDGVITDKGIKAYDAREWRPFRVASSGDAAPSVTPSGVLHLPDNFPKSTHFPTGEAISALASLHHLINGHALPQKHESTIGWPAKVRAIGFENEMRRELQQPERTLYWGNPVGLGNQTLHVPTTTFYKGLIAVQKDGTLIELNPETRQPIGPAKELLDKEGNKVKVSTEAQGSPDLAETAPRGPEEVVAFRDLPKERRQGLLSQAMWEQHRFALLKDATGLLVSVRDTRGQEIITRLYPPESVQNVNKEEQRDPTLVAQQNYNDMAGKEAKILASNKRSQPDLEIG